MRHRLVIGLALLAGCTATPVDDTGTPVPKQVLVPVAYMTDRNIADASDPSGYFGKQRGEVSYGIATIGISTIKQGQSGTADWRRWAPAADPGSRNEVLDVQPLPAADFDDWVARESGDRSVLLYIHGYSKKFRTVARNTAILAYELNIRGVPILYSWPSRGSVNAYPADTLSVDWSQPHLEAFLRQLHNNDDIDTIHVIAHSMGNRGFLKVLLKLLEEPDIVARWKFGEIVLFAPDVDTATFHRDVAPVLANIESRVTLYVSAVDVPLRTSRRVNKYHRVGDAKESIVIVQGVETVDVTSVSTMLNGHSAHRDVPLIQYDLHLLINKRLGAAQRSTLAAMDTDEGRYWAANEDYEPEKEP